MKRDSMGIIAAIVTPMDKEGNAVDYEALKNLCHFQVAGGVQGLFICGSVGEGPLLTLEERRKIAETVVRTAGDRVAVIVNTGALRTRDAVHLTGHAHSIGAGGAALMAPWYYSLDHQALFEHFSEIADGVPEDFSLYLYNIPQNAKNGIDVSLVKKLVEQHPNMVGAKDSSMDFMYFVELQAALGRDYCILMGNDAWILPSLQMGGHGAISAAATVFPDIVTDIYRAYCSSDWEKALKAQDIVTSIRTVFRSYHFSVGYKKALEMRGLPVGRTRMPLRQLSYSEELRLRQNLIEMGLLQP